MAKKYTRHSGVDARSVILTFRISKKDLRALNSAKFGRRETPNTAARRIVLSHLGIEA